MNGRPFVSPRSLWSANAWTSLASVTCLAQLPKFPTRNFFISAIFSPSGQRLWGSLNFFSLSCPFVLEFGRWTSWLVWYCKITSWYKCCPLIHLRTPPASPHHPSPVLTLAPQLLVSHPPPALSALLVGSLHLAQVLLPLLASHNHRHIVSFLRSHWYNHIWSLGPKNWQPQAKVQCPWANTGANQALFWLRRKKQRLMRTIPHIQVSRHLNLIMVYNWHKPDAAASQSSPSHPMFLKLVQSGTTVSESWFL